MSNEWYTPAKYIEAARLVMGGIDLDPASCEMANRIVRATRYYNQEENGLMQPWHGRVWLNPPYHKTDQGGASSLEIWVCHLLTQLEMGRIEQAILLVPMTQATRWFDRLWDYLQCFPRRRIHFYSSEVNDWRPRFSSSFAYFGAKEDRFIEIFSQFGRIVRAIDTPKPRPIARELWAEEVCS